MDKTKVNNSHGGKREGAGRPRGDSKLYTFRAPGNIAKIIDEQENKTDFIKNCILASTYHSEPDFTRIGQVTSADIVEDVTLPFFDIGVVAGFPVPLDNDERAQNIEMLQMLCPNPESCYLIRVKGDSMIDADIYSGDIIIVDKSQRNPSSRDVAVCELNGEYTIKRFERRGKYGWLIPANPEFPEIKITEADEFRIWGVVTFVIHAPRG